MELETLNLDCEFLTPAFLGNANQDAELRTAPFKGMLRWWYRQIYHGNENEDKIFGSTNCSSKVKIEVKGNLKEKPNELRNFTLKWLAYGGTTRNVLPENKSFSLKISYPIEHKNIIKTILTAIDLFGCIGLKSRNGFGSIHIKNLEKFPNPIPNASYFETRENFGDWQSALQKIGDIYKGDDLKFYRRMLKNEISKNRYDRYPKHLLLKVVKENDKFKGRILVLKKQGENYEEIKKKLKEHLNEVQSR